MLKDIMNSLRKIKQAMNYLAAPITWVAPGHYYSPIPDPAQIRVMEKSIWGKKSEDLLGINLNTNEQLKLLDELQLFYSEMPFGENKQHELRYYFNNGSYSYSDAIFLYSMIRFLKPRRIIEVGSGFSSAVILDTNDLFFGGRIDCRFIEPYPSLFLSLLKEKDNVNLISKNLQDVEPELFSQLQPNDILFIDTTHVSKTGSDVNYLFFNILPRLKKGVYVHMHDIFFPFEYPKVWVYEGRAWNEAYILRAFLQYNESFKIVLFNTFLSHAYKEVLASKMPLCLKNTGGSIWMLKSADDPK